MSRHPSQFPPLLAIEPFRAAADEDHEEGDEGGGEEEDEAGPPLHRQNNEEGYRRQQGGQSEVRQKTRHIRFKSFHPGGDRFDQGAELLAAPAAGSQPLQAAVQAVAHLFFDGSSRGRSPVFGQKEEAAPQQGETNHPPQQRQNQSECRFVNDQPLAGQSQ